MTERENEILALIKLDPMIAQQTLADKLGLSRSAVAGHIMNLTRKGFIQGKGYVITPERYAVVIGGANMDLCGRSSNELVLGDSNPGVLTSSAGGVGRNIADNLGRLGSKVQFIGAIGDDKWGEQLKQACHLANVGVDHCVIVNGATTSSYLSIHGPDGEMQIALNDMGLIEELNAETLAARDGVLSRAGAIVLDANLCDSALDYLFSVHSDKPILVDPVSSVKASKLVPYLDRIHTLKPNKLEAELLSGIKIETLDQLPSVADALHKKGVTRLLISLGHLGAFSSTETEQRFIPPSATQVNNVTGAGDALMAGLAHGHMSDWSWQKSVDFALAAACLALKADKTINSTMSEHAVQRLLEETSRC
ncbi:winged helix-turn-helix transcriptional regulator [Vibrio sp. 404]|uniref:Winged helix-turn-helix transcriptional regulator n=1 Tax=Vibrio marinisediminis TaxID=2758441 RepID=A0A7W2IVH6_9VIBR|nr:PfkB family carbohydrate kinase [Vibrio marinisediminis]MBA5764393.1 winged helix-turn-helix transcriptional regulator [Vibrio marinisediminis]